MRTNKQVEAVRQWYDSVAESFQERYEGEEGEYLSGFEDLLYDRFVDCTNKKVLDLGTGGGRYALRISGIAEQVYGVDISEKMIQIAQARKSSHVNVHFETGDAAQLRFSNGQFDVVVSAGMFEYMKDMAPFFHEVHRVLKPSGVFVFTCHRATSNFFGSRMYRMTMNVLRRLIWRVRQTGYSLKLDQRGKYYQKSYHRYDDIKKLLARYGFDRIQRQTSFFSLPTLLFALGSITKSPLIKHGAVRLNAFLSFFPISRGMGSVIIIKARKSKS